MWEIKSPGSIHIVYSGHVQYSDQLQGGLFVRIESDPVLCMGKYTSFSSWIWLISLRFIPFTWAGWHCGRCMMQVHTHFDNNWPTTKAKHSLSHSITYPITVPAFHEKPTCCSVVVIVVFVVAVVQIVFFKHTPLLINSMRIRATTTATARTKRSTSTTAWTDWLTAYRPGALKWDSVRVEEHLSRRHHI